MARQTSTPIVYRVRVIDPSPAPDASWAVTVQWGEDDMAPRVLAYARAEHTAERICRALRQSDRTALRDNARAATLFAVAQGNVHGDSDDA